MSDASFVALVTAAHAYLTGRQDALTTEFGLSSYERWDWDDARGAVVFSDGGVPRVIAQAQLVGSFSGKTSTWLWAWANSSVEPRLYRDLAEVRRFGEHQGIWQLTTAKWEAEETDGWEMTSITAYVLQAKGAYRMPHGHLRTFAILESIAWAPGAHP
jgi:hypothetical protein